VTQGKTLSRDYKHVKKLTPGAQAFTGWMGLLAGLAIGLSVALGVFLHYRNLPLAEPEPATGKPPASARAAEDAAPAPVDPAKDYTFYNMLPEQEIEVPKAADKPGKPVSGLPAGDVVLQAGAFKQSAEADKLQAKLAQYGVDSKDETWYRVRIGPISTVQELETIRSKLAEAEVEATTVSPSAGEPPP
jgi:cell division protein FtsN